MRLGLSTVAGWTIERAEPAAVIPPDSRCNRLLFLVLRKGFAHREVFYCEDLGSHHEEAWFEEHIHGDQVRNNADNSEWIKILGVYGHSSNGSLFSVTLPNSDLRSPSGMSEAEIIEKYPYIQRERAEIA